MKKLKLNILMIAGLFIGSHAMAQGGFFESDSQIQEQEVAQNPTDPGDEEAPIDDYLPLLIIGGMALAFFNRKKLAKIAQ